MGRVAQLLSFVRAVAGTAKVSDATVDRGAGDDRTAQHFSDTGDDSVPLPGDYAHLSGQAGEGRDSVVGYIDPANEQKAGPGEKRIYARDPSTGAQVVEVWLMGDGSAIIDNGNGSILLQDDGEVNINGARITTDGRIIDAGGHALDEHYHTQGNDSNGDSEPDTSTAVATE